MKIRMSAENYRNHIQSLETLREAKRLDDSISIAVAYRKMAEELQRQSAYSDAKEALHTAMFLLETESKDQKAPIEYAKTELILGDILQAEGSFNEASAQYEQALNRLCSSECSVYAVSAKWLTAEAHLRFCDIAESKHHFEGAAQHLDAAGSLIRELCEGRSHTFTDKQWDILISYLVLLIDSAQTEDALQLLSAMLREPSMFPGSRCDMRALCESVLYQIRSCRSRQDAARFAKLILKEASAYSSVDWSVFKEAHEVLAREFMENGANMEALIEYLRAYEQILESICESRPWLDRQQISVLNGMSDALSKLGKPGLASQCRKKAAKVAFRSDD